MAEQMHPRSENRPGKLSLTTLGTKARRGFILWSSGKTLCALGITCVLSSGAYAQKEVRIYSGNMASAVRLHNSLQFESTGPLTPEIVLMRSSREFQLRAPYPKPDDERISVLPKRRTNDDSHVVPPGYGAGEQGVTLEVLAAQASVPPKQVDQAITSLNASKPHQCTGRVVRELNKAQKDVQLQSYELGGVPFSTVPGPDERLYQYLKANRVSSESRTAILALQGLESAWRDLLAKCFVPAAERPLFATVSNRVGAFATAGNMPFCSGTLVRTGQVLTARHCFFNEVGDLIEQNIVGLTFRLSDGSATLAPDIEALRTHPKIPMSPRTDWIVLNVPATVDKMSALEIASVITPFDASQGAARPTSLEIFSVVPLSKILDPARFPEAIASHAMAGCYPVQSTSSCFTNMCAAVGGGSGAGLFAANAATPQLVGMHLGRDGEYATCSAGGQPVYGNFALRPVGEMLQYLSK